MRAVAEVAPFTLPSSGGDLSGEYRGPFAQRQGKPMRPDVALAFDRMSAAARTAGVALIITSAFRTNAEQAALFAAIPIRNGSRRPGSRCTGSAPSSTSVLPRRTAGWRPTPSASASSSGTLGAVALRVRARRRHAQRRLRSRRRPQRHALLRPGALGSRDLPRRAALERRRRPARRAALAGVALQPVRAVERRGPGHRPVHARHRQGLQPGRPFDGEAAILAQAHLMHDLLAQFGSVPLALAAYNAGAGAVSACGCIPQIPETITYVATILGLLGGTGDPAALATGPQGPAGGLTVITGVNSCRFATSRPEFFVEVAELQHSDQRRLMHRQCR